jgi:hypothetical protein
MGGAYFSYEESLPDLDTEFSTGSFASWVAAEGDIHGLSPFGRLRVEAAAAEETADLPGGAKQTNDLALAGLLLDLGLGFRVSLGEQVTLVPAVAYTLDLMAFEREAFRVDGVAVDVLDLDGSPEVVVEESIRGHGVSAGLALELRPISGLDVQVYGVFTHLPEVRVDSALGGAVSTEGFAVRGGVAAYVWIQPHVGIGGEVALSLRALDRSGVDRRRGRRFSGSARFPDSDTTTAALTVGVLARF